MNKQTVVYLLNGILSIEKGKRRIKMVLKGICNNLVEPQVHCAKSKKPDLMVYTPYDSVSLTKSVRTKN